jgi:predicted amidohydrolase
MRVQSGLSKCCENIAQTQTRPVVNNINTPAYQLAKFLSKNLNSYLNLPNTFNIINSTTVAQDISEINISEHCRLITYDIKDLHINISIEETLHLADFYLKLCNVSAALRNKY